MKLAARSVQSRGLFVELTSTSPIRFAVVSNVAVDCLTLHIRNVLMSNLGLESDGMFFKIVVL